MLYAWLTGCFALKNPLHSCSVAPGAPAPHRVRVRRDAVRGETLQDGGRFLGAANPEWDTEQGNTRKNVARRKQRAGAGRGVSLCGAARGFAQNMDGGAAASVRRAAAAAR